MISIKKNSTITATNVKSGNGKNGAWWLCNIKSEKGYDSITLWCNDCTAQEGDTVTITDILEVKKGARKVNEKWYDTFDVTAKLQTAAADFAELETEDELPF